MPPIGVVGCLTPHTDRPAQGCDNGRYLGRRRAAQYQETAMRRRIVHSGFALVLGVASIAQAQPTPQPAPAPAASQPFVAGTPLKLTPNTKVYGSFR